MILPRRWFKLLQTDRWPPSVVCDDHCNQCCCFCPLQVLHIATSGSTPRSPAVSAARKPAGPGNVLVAHLQEGMEAIHLYSGRTICRCANA